MGKGMSIFAPDQKCSQPLDRASRGGHAMTAEARSVAPESEIARRGIKLSAGIAERCGPCPVCGGMDSDRSSKATIRQ
jgi:hypothetical protein